LKSSADFDELPRAIGWKQISKWGPPNRRGRTIHQKYFERLYGPYLRALGIVRREDYWSGKFRVIYVWAYEHELSEFFRRLALWQVYERGKYQEIMSEIKKVRNGK
jgi:hypothetical protein